MSTNVIKQLDVVQSTSTTGFVFGCASDGTTNFNFFKMKVYKSSTSSSSDLYLKKINTGLAMECSGLQALDDNTMYLMVYLTSGSTNIMFLYSITWTDPSCTYSVTSYKTGIDKNTIDSRILTGPKWYFGGKNIWNFDTDFSLSSSYNIGYIFSSDSSESYITLSTYPTTSGQNGFADTTSFSSESVSTTTRSTGIETVSV